MELNTYLRDFSRFSLSLLKKMNLSPDMARMLNALLLVIILITITYVIYQIVRRILRIIVIQMIRKTNNTFFKFLLDNRVPHFISLIAPLILLYNAIPVVFRDYKKVMGFLLTLSDIYLILTALWVLMAVVKAVGDLLRVRPGFKGKPIDSYIQVIRIILYIVCTVVLFSNLTGKSPVAFFTAMGAISAVLLLMFKDTIMGFVASIQVTTNDIVRIGDWITMPKYGADGDIREISLTTVKVQNFDHTITTIPTYALISDSFQNWRGMSQSGGRRIKRAIHIKQSSIRFLREDELPNFEKIQALTSFIDHRQKDIEKHNARVNADKSLPINGRNLTNAGLYRKYIDTYITSHPGTNKKLSIMVRQLAPTQYGLPIEIYMFTSTVVWAEHEYIMADIFDHIIAAAPYFGLSIFELEGAGDVKRVDLKS